MVAGDRDQGCVLCRAIEAAREPASLVVHVAALNVVVMNLYPYNGGHLMIAPRRHLANLRDARPEELGEMMLLARRTEEVFQEVYRSEGINLGMNLGRSAGAGVADHFHLHMVPRWTGDTNFMTVLGGTRVLPEEPAQSSALLRPYFANFGS